MADDLNTKVLLLRGKPVPVNEHFNFVPKTLGEIATFPFSDMLLLANIFFLDLNKLKANFAGNPELDKASPFQILLLLLGQEEKDGTNETREAIIKSLNTFTDAEWVFDGVIHNGKIPFKEEDWFKMREIIAKEFGFESPESEEYNLANEKAKQFKEKRKKMEEEVKNIKNKKQDDNDFSDLISAVAAKAPGLNIINVWEITMYQMTDQLKRMNLIDTYEFNLRALLAGADSKKIDVQHWTSKI